MKTSVVAIVTVFLIFSSICFGDEPIQSVSMIRLIADPARYDGKLVRVEGFMRIQLEGEALYLHREDCENALLMNAIALAIYDPSEMRKYDRKYVFVEGTFKAFKPDSFGPWSGYIKEIRRVEFTK